MRATLLVAVLLVVALVAGCVGQIAEGGTKVESADVVVTAIEPTVPAQPVAGSAFTARFTVKNQHPERTAADVGVWIFDTGRCTLRKINGVDAGRVVLGAGAQQMWPGLVIKTDDTYDHTINFAPGQQEVVRLDMTAPTSEQLAGLPGSCPIRYRVNYSFAAVSEVTVQAISAERLAARETETGQRPVFTRTLSVGAGPLRVFMEPKVVMPVESGQPLRVELIIRNEGTGEFNKIAVNQLSLGLDKEWKAELSDGAACGGFFNEGTEEGGRTVYRNRREIDLVQKVSNPIRCTWTAPAVEIERQFIIQARLPYTYDYFGQQITVPITP